MKNIPKISNQQIEKHLEELNTFIVNNKLPLWFKTELVAMQKENPELLKYLEDRTSKIAIGASLLTSTEGVLPPYQIVMAVTSSIMLEIMVVLLLISRGITNKEEKKKFLNDMENWFKPEELGGLIDI